MYNLVMKVKVAVLQYDCPEDVEESFRKLNEMVGQASFMGAKLVVTPETAVGNLKEVKSSDVDYKDRLSDMAKRNRVYLATSYYKKEAKKYFNQGKIFDPKGNDILSHKKIYPTKLELEDEIESGSAIEVVDTEMGRLGMIICKDGFNKYSQFLYQKLADLEVDIICVPSWSLGWKEMDTQEYIKGLYAYGAFLSRAYLFIAGNLNVSTNSFGRSLVISPIRGVLKEGSINRREIIMEEIDLDEVKKAREFDSWWQPKKKIEIK